MAETGTNATDKKTGITPAKTSQAGKRAEQQPAGKTVTQQPAPTTTVYKPPPGAPPCHVPPPPPAPAPSPSPSPSPTDMATIMDLLQRVVAGQELIATEHQTFQDMFQQLIDINTKLATATESHDKYYDTPITAIAVATPTQPNSPDTFSDATTVPPTPGYQAETIYATLGRISPKVTIINDGTDTLFVISSPEGKTWSSEVPILIGEARTFWNVFELRLRSPTAGALGPPRTGGVYRVLERDFWLAYSNAVSSAFLSPHSQANQSGFALPAANSGWLASLGLPVITPTSTPTILRIMVAVSVVGIFQANIFVGGVAIPVPLAFNAVAGPALVADSLYIFEMMLHAGDTVDFSYSVGAGTVRIFRVDEIDAAIST